MSRINESHDQRAQSFAEHTGVSNLSPIGKAGLAVAGIGMAIFGVTIAAGVHDQLTGGTSAVEADLGLLTHTALDGGVITLGGLALVATGENVSRGERKK